MRCRLILAVSVAIALLASVAPTEPSAQASARPRQIASPPGQVFVVSANAWQFRPLGVFTFRRLLELALALRTRPAAFNGGFRGAVTAPDVITVQEIRLGNAETFLRLIRQRYNFHYDLIEALEPDARPVNPRSRLIYNTETVELVDVHEWRDACLNGLAPHDDEPKRVYQWARFVDKRTGAPFVVAGIHFRHRYPDPDCHPRNVDLLRLQVEAERVPVIIMGDFNRRAVQIPYTCDPDERSDPTPWWSRMTSPGAVERSYVDTVAAFHRRSGRPMENEWTFETKRRVERCDGRTDFRRARIDYIFADDAVVAQAHTDHPGWAGPNPGDRHPENHYYSDHRFLWARLVVSGPQRPPQPVVEPQARGAIQVDWDGVDGVGRYVVYRARPRRALARVGIVTDGETSFRDTSTEHGVRYRYRITAIGPNGGHSFESLAAAAVADARGPRIVHRRPAPGAPRVPRGARIEVRYDERVARSSVTSDRIELFRGTRRVRGRVSQERPRLLVFEPARRLARNTRYRVVARPVADTLGNRGTRSSWRFTTRRR